MARTTMMSALLVTNPELIAAAESVRPAGYAVIVMRTLPSLAALRCSDFTFAVYPDVSDSLALWHSSLERFGALELNDRYRSRWKTGMSSAAWASWVAIKILSEASLRTQSVEPFLLLDYIRKSEFDGHKGWPLTFRSEDHVLRQPFYVISPGASSKVRAELPSGGRSETESAAQVLDRILPPHADPRCAKTR